MRNRAGSILLLVVAAVLGTGIVLQAAANAALRRSNRSMEAELASVGVAPRGGTTGPSVITPPVLEADLEVARLKASIQQLRTQLSAGLMRSTVRSHAGEPRNAERWTDKGRETPADAVHSFLRACMNGDMEKLPAMLAFDDDLTAAINERFQTLPESVRAEFGSAERLAATVVAARTPTELSAAELIDTSEEGPQQLSARFLLLQGSARPENAREVTLRFKRADDGWKLIVPASALR